MADSDKGRQPPRPPAAGTPGARPPGGPRVLKVGQARQRTGTSPLKRQPVDRARAVFAVVGLLVIVSMVLGSFIFALDFAFEGSPEQDPWQRQANLVPTLEAQVRENPNDVQTINILANTLQNNGDYPGAIRWYERSIELKPEDAETRFAFGQALAAYGQRVDAEVQYGRAIELAPGNARNHYYLGQLYERWDPPRLEEARQQYTRAAELEPEGPWGRAARSQLDRLMATPTP